MESEKFRDVDQNPPDELVLPAGQPQSLFPPVQALVFKRDHSSKGIVYEADVREWFRKNGQNGIHIEKTPEGSQSSTDSK
jgi:hypothetical protein